MKGKEKPRRLILSILAMGALVALGACGLTESATGSFDRTLTVNGPVEVHITNGSGRVDVKPGPEGQVHVHGDFIVHAWPWQDARQRAAEVASNPPIEQQGSLIRIGGTVRSFLNLSVSYTVEAPAGTELDGVSGSGGFSVAGIQGPVHLIAGSGTIQVAGVKEDVETTTGSGDVSISGVGGNVEITAGSGNIQTAGCKGETRIRSASGDISVAGPGSAVSASTGSGSIRMAGIEKDVRISTGSGNITVAGNPAPNSYWNLVASSGDVMLQVPPDANFHLFARSEAGAITTRIPIVVEENGSKHELRARVGQGAAQVEIHTHTGDINLE